MMNFMFLILILFAYASVIFQTMLSAKKNLNNTWKKTRVFLDKKFFLIDDLLKILDKKISKSTMHHVNSTKDFYYELHDPYEIINLSKSASFELNKMLDNLEPELRNTIAIQNLLNEIKRVDNKILNTCYAYNKCAKKFNNMLVIFPNTILAPLFKIYKQKYFNLEHDK